MNLINSPDKKSHSTYQNLPKPNLTYKKILLNFNI